MSQAKWRVVGRRIVTAAKALYHGISLVGFAEDAKTLWTGLGSVLVPMVLRFQQVREWLLDRTTYLLALEQIGEYGPWFTGSIFLLVLIRRAYLRGLPEVLEAEGLAEHREELAPVLPPRPDVDDEALVFRGLEEELFAVLEYLRNRDGKSSYKSLDLDGRMWALEDDLKKLDLRFPEPKEEGAKMLGLMKTGNLSRAREDFPVLPF